MAKGKKTTQTRSIPAWLERGSQQATGLARSIAERPYERYEGQRVASLDPNETQAAAMASSGAGSFRGDLNKARHLTERSTQTFTDANMDAYMNPYIKGALEPAARDLRTDIATQKRDVGSQAAQAGAFGGSRATLLETETGRAGTQAIGDLYARGYHQAFESGADRFAADREAAGRGADRFRALGSQGQEQLAQGIQNLLSTGGLRRNLKQSGLDFDYQQFTEARDWDVTNLQPLLATLSSVPHTVTQEANAPSNVLGQIMGMGATAAGAFFGGGGAASMFGGSSPGALDAIDAPTSFGQDVLGGGGGMTMPA